MAKLAGRVVPTPEITPTRTAAERIAAFTLAARPGFAVYTSEIFSTASAARLPLSRRRLLVRCASRLQSIGLQGTAH